MIEVKAKTTVKLPTNLKLWRNDFMFFLRTIERDIHRHVEAGVDIEGKPQKQNKPSTRAFKRKHGLPDTPLMMGWRPYGYHRFTSRFGRTFGNGYAALWLHRSKTPGGFAGQAEVARYLTAMGYRVPFGVSRSAQKTMAVYIYRQFKQRVRRRTKRL